MDAELVMLAARLVGCAPTDVLAVRWRDGGLAVVWGIGWKKVFPRAAVDALVPDPAYIGRAQMIIAPPDNIDGLDQLFSRRLVAALVRAGYTSPEAVRIATDEALNAVGGIGPATLREIRELLK